MFSSSTSSRRIIQNSIKSITKKPSSNGSITIQNQQQRFMSKNLTSNNRNSNNRLIQYSILTAGVATLLSAAVSNDNVKNETWNTTFCDYIKKTGGEIVMLGPTKEGSTGILFPHLCNGMQFVGCGVRVKYGFIKV